ncbi:glycoside hydrolase family 2 protein [Tropicimonas sp. IMCC34043]|uniref:beta-mannosidase n=1 Tax=Tropicimonas sp. IMCC34043 TaxID=2248760 RepID=UPI000E254A93|nr:glycoside hydrolase family 2 protein [Tropicimonas sp. IMCC34043]
MQTSHHSGALDLSGVWRLTDGDGALGLEIALPGDVITALQAAGRIPDPYWGRNEFDLRWIAERDWTLTREVALDRTDLVLVLDEIDTVATIRVNGIAVLDCANAHRRWRVDISGAARVGTNLIEITLKSAIAAAAAAQQAQPFFVPWHRDNSPIPNGNMLRKPQCDFGWDWNIALAPMGIYGAMRLEPVMAQRIGRLAITQDHGAEGVTVTVAAHLEGLARTPRAFVRFEFCDEHQTVIVPDGVTDPVVTAVFRIAEPALWWPAGLGEQPLCDLSVATGQQVERRRIGLRQIELVSEPDEIGRSFLVRVNGRPVFCRGANWIPADALAGRITREGVRELLQSAADANMNMIRIWGGGRYEPDWLHDICDELGLLVWQDFMFACNLYPSTPEFLAEVAAEVQDVVARLHHHASTALWCGDNELIGMLSWFPESRRDRDRYLVSYDRLNRGIEAALMATDPGANWWPSSPSPGPLSFGDAWHDDSAGDMHFWSVWHEGQDFDHYRDVAPRFCSEFGFQSYPSMAAIRRFAAPEDFNISAPVFESHQKNRGGNARIAETMFRYFRFPTGFEDFVYLSQVQQGLAIRTAVGHWRGLKPRCMGTLYWQLNDTWPVCSWSSLDHGGGWKILHHMARHFYAPVTVNAVPVEGGIALRAVNDTALPVTLRISASALSMDGSKRALDEVEVTVPTDAAIEALRTCVLAPGEMLVYRWTGPAGVAGTDHFAPGPYKSYDLRDPQIAMQVRDIGDGWKISLGCSAPAFFVALEADIPGRFSDAGFLLLPGDPVDITFTPAEPGARPNLTLRHLYGATCIAPAR